MATKTTKVTNGVSMGCVHTITSTDVSDGYVIIDFQVPYPISASLELRDSDGYQKELEGTKKSYPADGQVRLDDNVSGTAEVTSITCVADSSDSLDGTYFIIYDDSGSVGVWIDTDNSGTTAPAGASGADRALEVTGIATDDTASTVATQIASTINGDSKFSASATGGVVTVTDASVGYRTDASDGDTGFTITVTTEGSKAGTTFVAGDLLDVVAQRDSIND